MARLLSDAGPSLFASLAHRRLTWWPEIGVGHYPVEAGTAPYDFAYFERFARQADSEIGRALMEARFAFVERHWKGDLVDVGIGSGAFVELRNSRVGPLTFGFDVNPFALEWLASRGWLRSPYEQAVDAISLWDVLEHLPDFRPLLAQVRRFVFVSIPIFQGGGHVLTSKHYRKDEHVWYFTAGGLQLVMKQLGFDCVELNDDETKAGREDILSFAFRRNTGG